MLRFSNSGYKQLNRQQRQVDYGSTSTRSWLQASSCNDCRNLQASNGPSAAHKSFGASREIVNGRERYSCCHRHPENHTFVNSNPEHNQKSSWTCFRFDVTGCAETRSTSCRWSYNHRHAETWARKTDNSKIDSLIWSQFYWTNKNSPE